MRISMRCDYGIRAVSDLAKHQGVGPIPSAEIAARQSIPEAYLDQLLNTLRKGGLVKTVRGARGGHMLARTPDQLTMADVVHALEGTSAPVECLDDSSTCKLVSSCGQRDVWRQIQQATERILSTTTIADLVEREEAREQRAVYVI